MACSCGVGAGTGVCAGGVSCTKQCTAIPSTPSTPVDCTDPACEDIGPDLSDTEASWVPRACDYPTPPINVTVISPYRRGVLDLRWDNPAILAKNTLFNVVGVNIYRSTSSQRGPFHRINREPVGGLFYRDYSDNTLIQDEIVGWNDWLSRGQISNSREWKFKVKEVPMVKSEGNSIFASSPADVLVTIDGVQAQVDAVFGETGEVLLVNTPGFDFIKERTIPAVLPKGPESEVLVTYYRRSNFIQTNLDRRVWYRLTTVAILPNGEFIETPLEFTPPVVSAEVEVVDYIWREAIRRNNWILEIGGERAKVFIMKTAGTKCWCGKDPFQMTLDYQAKSDCIRCFGTGFLGGYDGPYDLLIAPEDGERNIEQGPDGKFLNFQYEVWTGPSPLLSQRDFIVRQTNERYTIGPIRRPSNRGNILQQHFQIIHLDESDIRYRVPLPDPSSLCWPETRYLPSAFQGGAWEMDRPPTGPYPVGNDYQAIPLQTSKGNVPDEREQRGRTANYEKTVY